MKKVAMMIPLCGLLLASPASAEQIVKPHTFSAGTPAQAEQVNADFDTVYGQVNKVGAAITVDGANNVGIGTATPAGELHVSKPTAVSEIIYTGGAQGNNLGVDAANYSGSGVTYFRVRVVNAAPPVDAIQYSSDNGELWSDPVGMVASGLNIGNNVLIGFAQLNGHNVGDQWAWTVSGFPDGLLVSNGKVTVKELAITSGAGYGLVLTSDPAGNASWQPAAMDGDGSATNELQTLSRKDNILTLSQGGGDVSIADDDSDPANELQTISRIGTNLTLSQGGGTVSLADNDNDPANELQILSLVGTNLTLSQGGGTVSINDGDSVIGNEYNTAVALSGTTLQVTDGGGVKSVDLAEKVGLGGLADVKDDGSSLFLGSGAGLFDDGANESVALGKNALSLNSSGQWNTAVGFDALQNNSSGWGNTAIGSHAGPVNDSGSFNTFLGYDAGLSNVTGSGNVFLGYNAGRSETGSNLLYITNRNDTTPLIYGEFLTDALTINGTLSTTGAFATAGNTTVGGAISVTGNLDVAGKGAIGANATLPSNTTFNVQGSATETYAGQFANHSTEGNAYGLYGVTSGVTNRDTDYHYGVWGQASGGLYNLGVEGFASDAAASLNRGVVGYAYYGTNAYGVYGYAASATTNYAGYFEGNLHTTGNLTYVGTLTDVSDERLKENIRPVENGLAKVAGLRGVYFNMKDNPGQTEVGVIAQDVQKVLPEAVSVIDQANGYLGVSYPSLIPVLIEAVKELQAANESKDAKIAELLQRVEALEASK